MIVPAARAYARPAADAALTARRDAAQRCPSQRLDQALDDPARPGVRIVYARDEEIYGEGEPAEFVYRVVSGAVRTYRVLSDGRRQVCDFHLPGEYFGLEPSLEHRATAEAMAGTSLLVLRRTALADLAERVAGFLVDFAARVDAREDFELPMSRQDIADYLGLTIETVSRTFSQLEHTGVLKAHNSRRIRLTDRRALEEMCA